MQTWLQLLAEIRLWRSTALKQGPGQDSHCFEAGKTKACTGSSVGGHQAQPVEPKNIIKIGALCVPR